MTTSASVRTSTPTVLNYSHPLSDAAREQLEEQIGPFREITVPCQIDFDLAIRPQLDRLVNDGLSQVAEPDYIIPPALSYAAAYIGARFASAHLIVLKRSASLPPVYVLAEIVCGMRAHAQHVWNGR